MLNKRWFGYISAYFFWVISLALALWFLILARDTLPSWIANSLLDNPSHAKQLATIIDRVLVLGGGCGWLAFLIIIEQYFRRGVILGKLWRRIAQSIGILLILIFLVDSCQMILNKISLEIWIRWLILLVELTLGIGLLYLSKNRNSRSSIGRRSS